MMRAIGVALLVVGAGTGAFAQGPDRAALREIGFDQKLGAQVDLGLELRDEAGLPVRLRELTHDKPVVLALVYYRCPMLCVLTLNGLAGALKTLSFDAGREFTVLSVSFNPNESSEEAAAKKAEAMRRYARPGTESGWRFLTGDAEAIAKLTAAVGFRYTWDEKTRQYAHAAGLVVLTPDGRVARYLFGVEYAPKDLRLALVEASEGQIGSPVDHVLLYCYSYNPATGRYGAAVMRLVRIAGAVTVLALGLFVLAMWRRERSQHRSKGEVR
jgi:protein SCO1